MVSRFSISFFFLLCSSISIFGQRGSDAQSNSTEPDSIKSVLDMDFAEEDTSSYEYFYIDDIDNRKTYDKNGDIHQFYNYSRDKLFEDPQLTLGNFGSSQRPVLHRINENISNTYDLRQYDAYHESVNKLAFYELNTALNDLFFSPVGGQQNFLVKAKFSRNFKNNTNISLDYQRINQAGFYTNQDTKITSFGIGLWNASENKKRNTFFRIIANNSNENHNGGITSDINLFNGGIYNVRTTIPTFIDDGVSRRQSFKYILDNLFKLDKFTFWHQISYQSGYYKYADDLVSAVNDSTIYKSYIVQPQGIRLYYGDKNLENDFSINFKYKSVNLSAGINYGQRWFDLDIETLSRNDLFLYGKLNTDFGKVAFKGLFKTGLLSAAGNVLAKANLDLPISEWVNLFGNFTLSRYNAGINHSNIIINQEKIIYDQGYNKITESAISAGIKIPKLKTKFKWTAFVSDNLIYYTPEALPLQNENAMVGSQLELQQKIKFWSFHFDNAAHLQFFDDNLFNLPEIYSRHELYVQSRTFKKRLLYDIGVAYIHIWQQGAISYMPLLGQFYSEDQTLAYYPYTEVFANFKIDDFKVFLKAENATQWFLKQPYYQITNYPQFDYKLRLGVSWFLRA